MPHYYFDLNDGQNRTLDEDGQELPSFAAARQVAIEQLSQMLRDEVPDGDRASYVVTLRGPSREPLYIATATLLCEPLAGEPPGSRTSAAPSGRQLRDPRPQPW